MKPEIVAPTELEARVKAAQDQLDKHAYETIQHHFHDSTGCPFWLGKKKELKFDPLKEVKCYADIQKFPLFEDEWLRGGPVNRWIPKGLAGKPAYVFETGGTTGVPKSRIAIDDFRTELSVVAVGDSIIEISVKNNDPKLAQQLTAAVIESYSLWKLNGDRQCESECSFHGVS